MVQTILAKDMTILELKTEFKLQLVEMDYDPLMGLITQAENLYNRQKNYREIQKTYIIKPGSGLPPKLAIAAQILITL